jgi:hypothetical protein
MSEICTLWLMARGVPGGRAAGAGPDDGNCLTALRKQRTNIYPGPLNGGRPFAQFMVAREAGDY